MKLYPGRAPNYRLKAEFEELPQGSFVRPVKLRYLPKHILDELSPFFDEQTEAACFTAKGFLIIPWKIIEET